jgi:hypothetical protein
MFEAEERAGAKITQLNDGTRSARNHLKSSVQSRESEEEGWHLTMAAELGSRSFAQVPGNFLEVLDFMQL